MKAVYQRKIVVNGQLQEASGVQAKVEQDIAFLQHRIAIMKKQKIPNSVVIETYENMFEEPAVRVVMVNGWQHKRIFGKIRRT